MQDDGEDKLFYLLSGSCQVIPSSYYKLRSYLNIHASNLGAKHNLKLIRNRNKACPYCFTSWDCNANTFQLLPTKKFNRKKQKAKRGLNNSVLNEAKEPEIRNTLVLKCKVCLQKSSFSCIKKQHPKEIITEVVKTHKKKKKKKDKNCGLLVDLKKNTASQDTLITNKKRDKASEELGGFKRNDNSMPGLFVLKKDKRNETKEKPSSGTPTSNNSNTPKQSKTPINIAKKKKSGYNNSKQLVLNPFAVQSQSNSKKNNNRLEELKKAIKGETTCKKKTLKDFLTLI